MPDSKKRIAHIHIPKTAGTAIREAFLAMAPNPDRVFPSWRESDYKNIDASNFDFFSGHIGYKTAIGLDAKIITVLRNPVDRFISVYHFWRQIHAKGAERSSSTHLASIHPLSEFVCFFDNPFITEEFFNRSTFQLAYGSDTVSRCQMRERGMTDDQILSMAVKNLKNMAVVGIQENLPAFQKAINDTFGLWIDVQRTNITNSRPEVMDIPTNTRKRIHEWVYLDLELYQEALNISHRFA